MTTCSGETTILATQDRTDWEATLSEVGQYDFYHLPSYHQLAELTEEGDARLFVYREADAIIAFPMLLRPVVEIPGLADVGGNWSDVTSVYGYPGPVHSGEVVPDNVRQGFFATLEQFFNDQGVVCAFSRLHPLLYKPGLLDDYGKVIELGATVSIDLTLSPEEQIAQYRRDTKREVIKLVPGNLSCFEDVAGQYWHEFTDIYYETMNRVAASPVYYFDKEYFAYLRDDMADTFHLFVCTDGETVAAAALFAICNGIIQYHLSGIRKEYLATRPSPTRLLIDSVRKWGNEVGAHTFHLGGGSGSKRDSLFEFKRSFSKREHMFSVWQHIVNPEVYRELFNLRCSQAQKIPTDSYFPMYRHPEFST